MAKMFTPYTWMFRVMAWLMGAFFIVFLVVWLATQGFNFLSLLGVSWKERFDRLGLILQFIGIFSVLPDLMKGNDAEKWENWLKIWNRPINVSFWKTIKGFTIDLLFEENGFLGLINLTSRFLFIITIHYFAFSIFIDKSSGLPMSPILLILLMVDLWAIFWLLIWRYRGKMNLSDPKEINTLELMNFSFGLVPAIGSIIFFIPLLLIALPTVSLLKELSKYPIRTVFIRVTFPFLFVGTLLQLVSAFMQ